MTTLEQRISRVAQEFTARMRTGEGLSVPYARKWDVRGCRPKHSLWTYPHDALATLSSGLVLMEKPLVWKENAVQIGDGLDGLWVGVDRSIRGEGPPEDYLLGRIGKPTAAYVSNSPEVILEMIGQWGDSVGDVAERADLQIGFPGMEGRRPIYVGSWQWNLHGEASDDDFIKRAAAATVAAIVKASA
ncbi:hypothetical protein ACXYX3_04290 [Mycobacterium sp. C3-094]